MYVYSIAGILDHLYKVHMVISNKPILVYLFWFVKAQVRHLASWLALVSVFIAFIIPPQ